MKNFFALLIVVSLLGCGTSLALKKNPDATYGVTPVLELDEGVNPDETVADEVIEIVNPGLEALSESAPTNPVDLTGWIAAAGLALVAVGGAAAKKYLFKKKK